MPDLQNVTKYCVFDFVDIRANISSLSNQIVYYIIFGW